MSGKQLGQMPERVQALRSQEIGYSHLKVMARTASAVGTLFDEKELLPLARKSSADLLSLRLVATQA